MTNLSSTLRLLVSSDTLRPALLLSIGQVMLALLGALLLTNGLLG